MTTALCPAIILTAPASGQGKTTVAAALARLLKRQGKVVRVFKIGPDYLDPQVLQQASGQVVEPLDIWMAGDSYCQQQLYQAANSADMILIEGAMGMFDGEPSSADLAARFAIPMVIVMDVKGMAQTAAAIAVGMANYRSNINIVGFIANHCSTERHRQLIADALPGNLPLLATLTHSEKVALPERHLGLVQAFEVEQTLESRFDVAANWLEHSGIDSLMQCIAPVEFFFAASSSVKPLLHGITLGIANDAAFSFIYQSNLHMLSDMGAKIVFFSPLFDQQLPDVDALWLPGGYPELHAKTLANNRCLIRQLQRFFEQDKPILAECGGFLYCLKTLTDLQHQQYPMAGLLSGHGVMVGRRGCQGMQTALLPEGEVRAHAHHRSQSSDTPEPIAYAKRQRHDAPGEAIYRQRQLTASYLHLFFPSNPLAIATLFSQKVSSC